MNFKKPAFLKNVTPKMLIVWAVSLAVILVLGFGTVAIAMVSVPKNYSQSIKAENVLYIQYRNGSTGGNGKQLFWNGMPSYEEPMKDILKLLSNGGKTNALANLFRGGDPEKIVEGNNTDTHYSTTFESTYRNNSIVIRFSEPQHSIVRVTNTTYKLDNYGSPDSVRDVYGIMIPLDKINNRFQPQTWFLITSNPYKTSQGATLTLYNKISTYGNYSKLWDYISDLDID